MSSRSWMRSSVSPWPEAKTASRVAEVTKNLVSMLKTLVPTMRVPPAPAVSGQGQQSPRRSRPRAPEPRPWPHGVAARARRTARDRPTGPASARRDNLRGQRRAPLPRQTRRRHPPTGDDSAVASVPRPRCRRGTRAAPRTRPHVERATPELDCRVSPSSLRGAMRALGGSRSSGEGRRHLRNRAARLHASLYAKQHPALHLVVEQLAGTTLDQRCDRPEQRPDDRDLAGEWLEPAAAGPGDQACL